MYLPELFVIGAPKCGTTSLYQLLNQTNHFRAPMVKEPNFFEYDLNYRRGIASYSRLFDTSTGDARAVGFEATPWYLYSNSAAERIERDVGSEVRIIVCVRDPIDRAISMYRDRAGGAREIQPFAVALTEDLKRVHHGGPSFEGRSTSFLSGSFYYAATQPWIRRFGRESLRFITLSEISSRPTVVVAGVLDWFGRPSTDAQQVQLDSDQTNAASSIQRPRLDAAIRRTARARIARDVLARIPWGMHVRLGRGWRTATRSSMSPVTVAEDEKMWLRDQAAGIFREDMEGLRSLGVDSVTEWPTYRG